MRRKQGCLHELSPDHFVLGDEPPSWNTDAELLLNFASPEELESMQEQAERQGYASLEDYILAVLRQQQVGEEKSTAE